MRVFPVFGAAAVAILTGGCGPRQGGAMLIINRDGTSPAMIRVRCPAGAG